MSRQRRSRNGQTISAADGELTARAFGVQCHVRFLVDGGADPSPGTITWRRGESAVMVTDYSGGGVGPRQA
jgi:hypothetical protein